MNMDQFSYRISGLRIGVVLTILFSATSAWAESPDMRVRKKLIATAWDHPDSQWLFLVNSANGPAAFDVRDVPEGWRLEGFQRNWEAIIREWSLRWGKSVSGRWIDGCCFADQMNGKGSIGADAPRAFHISEDAKFIRIETPELAAGIVRRNT